MSDMNDRIQEIGARLEELHGEIDVLEDERDSLKQDIAGVHRGDIVTVTSRGRSFDVLVDAVDTRWDNKPWIRGFKRKKNGEWGSQAHNYYSDWKLAKP